MKLLPAHFCICCGMICMKKPFGFLEDVFVEEQFRGKGYGEKDNKSSH